MNVGALHRQAVQDVVDALADAGLSASTDPGAVQVPGAWLLPGDLTLDRLSGVDGVQRIDVHLVVPDTGVDGSRAALAALLDQVLVVIDPDGPIDTRALVQLPEGPPLPAFVVPVDVELNTST